MVGRAVGLGATPRAVLAAPAVVGSADVTLRPASGRTPEILRLVGRGFLVAAGAVGISLLFSAAKTHAADDASDPPAPDADVVAPVTELTASVTDVLAPVVETTTGVVGSVVGVDVAPQPDAAATQAAPATPDVADAETPGSGEASTTAAPTPAAEAHRAVAETAAPVSEARPTSVDSAVSNVASQPDQSTTAQAAPVSVDTAIAESPSGVAPEPTSATNGASAATPVAPATRRASSPPTHPDLLTTTVSGVVDAITSPAASTVGEDHAATGSVTPVSAAGSDAAPTGGLVPGTVDSVLGIVTSLPGVDIVLPAAAESDLLSPVSAVVEPVVAPVTGLVEPAVAALTSTAKSLPVIGEVGELVDATTLTGKSLPIVGDLVDTASLQPQTPPIKTRASAAPAASADDSAPAVSARANSVAAALPTPAAAATATTPVDVAGAAPAATQAPITPAPSALVPPSLLEISADTPAGDVGPSVETHRVSSDPYRELADVDHPAVPRDVTSLAVGSAPGVNTATSGSASHGDQAVVHTTASPSGDSTGERIQLERADVRAGVAANRVPTPE